MPKTDVRKHVREYLAYIGSLGGSTSRRELTKSHARQMVAIRAGKSWPPRDPKTLRLLKLK